FRPRRNVPTTTRATDTPTPLGIGSLCNQSYRHAANRPIIRALHSTSTGGSLSDAPTRAHRRVLSPWRAIVKIPEPSLKERTAHLYRRLALLQRLFKVSSAEEDVEWLEAGDGVRNLVLCAAIREVIDEVTEQARILASIPRPLNEWRPGDGPNDERWRALTELERRDVLSLASSYDQLLTWVEEIVHGRPTAPSLSYESSDTIAYLQGERARLQRWLSELAFLERRAALTDHATAGERPEEPVHQSVKSAS